MNEPSDSIVEPNVTAIHLLQEGAVSQATDDTGG